MTKYAPYIALALSLGGASCAVSQPYVAARRANPSSIAMLLVDMQPLFLELVDKKEAEEEIPNMARMLEYARENKIPVVVIEYKVHDFRIETIDALTEKLKYSPMEVRYVTKTHAGGFRDTNLTQILRDLDVSDVVLMGAYASACVIETAMGALNNNFGIMTSPDLIADPSDLGTLFAGPESSNWYQENGVWAEDHRKLMDEITTINARRTVKERSKPRGRQ